MENDVKPTVEDDAFFIGWQGEPPAPVRSFLRKKTAAILVVGLALAAAVALLQSTIGIGRFEFGDVKPFSGVLVADPVPTLVGDDGSFYYLVNPWKFGFPEDLADEFDLQHVSLEGTLIYNDLDAMIEVVDGSVEPASGDAVSAAPLGTVEDLGEVTLEGEIVDSKCYLGVMNPGVLKPHRACAIRCISGGIPPLLLVRLRDGSTAQYLLVDGDGGPANDRVLEFVAEPVRVRGTLVKRGARRIVRLGGEGAIERL